MVKFNLKESGAGLVFNSVNLTCLQSIEITTNAPSTEVECSGQSSVEYVTGIPRYQMAVNGALNIDDDAIVSALQPNQAGAVACDPAGTASGSIDLSSTNATISDFAMSVPINGFASYTATLLLDDFTIGTN